MDFPGSDTMVPDLERCHFFAEGEEKSLIQSRDGLDI